MALNESKINTCTCACMHTHTQHLFVRPFYQTRRTQAGKRLLPSGKGTQRQGEVSFSTVLALSKLINSLLWLQLNKSAKKYSKNVTFCSITSQLHMQCHFTNSFLNLCSWVRKRSIHSLLIAGSVGHLNLHTLIYINNCIYPNFSWSKIPYLDNLKAYKKRRKPLLNNGDYKFERKTKKTEARSGTLETGILKQLYLFSEEKSAVSLLLLQLRNNSATMEYIFMTYYN